MLNADGATAMENLQGELARAKEQARKSDAAAAKAAEELKAEQAAYCQSKKEMAEMAVKLKDDADRCKLREEDRVAQKDLEKVTAEAKDTRSAMRAMKEELRQAGDITAGKPYMLRVKFGHPKYPPLDRKWSAANTYLDLAASAADATEHFRGLDDHKLAELFWSQFHNLERPLLVSDRLAAWAELNRLSGLAMKDVVAHLWPKRPETKSYFGLVQQFLDAVPHIKAMKRSACIEGARMALARVKTCWAEMDATDVASRDSDRSRLATEHYFEEVLQGARLIESQCSKDVMFK